MRVVVTGGAGFIGSHVCDRLVADGHEVVAVDNLSAGNPAWLAPPVRLIVGDVRDPSPWQGEVGSCDAVIHLAAQISVPDAQSRPVYDLDVNVKGTVAMLEAARQWGARDFRMASSAAVYGNNENLPLSEDEPPAPAAFYGLGKWAAEQYLLLYAATHGMGALALRLANVYGPRQRGEGEGAVVAAFCQAVTEGRMPVIHGDGLQTRDFVAVSDVAAAFVHRLGRPGPARPYNVSTGQAITIWDLWRTVARVAGVPAEPVRHGPARDGDIRASCLNPDRAREWGFVPSVPLERGLADTLRYFAAPRAQ